MKNMFVARSFLFPNIAFAALVAFANPVLAAPDEDSLGKAQGYPIGTPYNWFHGEGVLVGSYSNLDKILPTHTLEKSGGPSMLSRAPSEPVFRYEYNGKTNTVDDFLAHQRVTGLLIIKNGEILVERYQYDRKPTDRFVSNSMAKSITSLAIGFALQEGKITSLDDKAAKYVPELAGYAYGEASLRSLLRMASGVKFSEDYSGTDDFQRFHVQWRTQGLIKAIQSFNERDAKESERFQYATSQTYILGLVLKRATGLSNSEYVDARIWKPMGAEADAKWATDLEGNEMAGGSFNATLRDYGRLGVLLANDGMLNGKQILPKDYLLEATDWHKQPAAFAPGKATPFYGYGYQFWILPGERRCFALVGRLGQMIYVDPEAKLVMVQTAVNKNTAEAKQSLSKESYLLWSSIGQNFQDSQGANLPPEIKQVFDQMSAAWTKRDMDGVMEQYHSDYSSSTAKSKSDMRIVLAEKLMPKMNRLEWKITDLRVDGDHAYLKGFISTDSITFPFADNTQLIKESGRWYIYGDRNPAQK